MQCMHPWLCAEFRAELTLRRVLPCAESVAPSLSRRIGRAESNQTREISFIRTIDHYHTRKMMFKSRGLGSFIELEKKHTYPDFSRLSHAPQLDILQT